MNSDKREMEAIVARLAPNAKPAGSGTTSDKDMGLYLRGLPGIDKPGDVNKAIRDQYSAKLSDAESELAFKERYLAQNGHLIGVEDARGNAVENGKTGGLDISKLSKDQIEALKRTDPEAYELGVARYERNNAQQAQPQKVVVNELPPANKANKDKIATDRETGKKYRSNGLQWVEVK